MSFHTDIRIGSENFQLFGNNETGTNLSNYMLKQKAILIDEDTYYEVVDLVGFLKAYIHDILEYNNDYLKDKKDNLKKYGRLKDDKTVTRLFIDPYNGINVADFSRIFKGDTYDVYSAWNIYCHAAAFNPIRLIYWVCDNITELSEYRCTLVEILDGMYDRPVLQKTKERLINEINEAIAGKIFYKELH